VAIASPPRSDSRILGPSTPETPLVSQLSLGGKWGVVAMLASREWLRFFRQRGRVIGALGTPVLMWLLLGTGMHGAFRGVSDQDYMTFFFPGTLALIVLFTSIFANISIIEDRREGFLQGVLAAPVPRWTIAAGKILGGAAIAWVQAVLLLAVGLATGLVAWQMGLASSLIWLAFIAFGLTALGFCFAWPMDSTQGFHAVMNLVLMPMWLLSGAFFPVPEVTASSGLGQWVMHTVMRLNPLTYAVAGLRMQLLPMAGGDPETLGSWQPSLWTAAIVTGMMTLFGLAMASRLVGRPWGNRRPDRKNRVKGKGK
jgi:ABC-2 type transport system permease protein